ncbi:MAG: aspartate kinase [SAR324 cluster bacterium]|nr:aspartate kinase [SAR324 cluster bacterium]
MSIVVQKFGGTSLGNSDRLKNVAGIIKNTITSRDLVVVVSALSSYTKAEGTTNRLLQAGQLAIQGGDFSKVIDLIEDTHLTALAQSINNPMIREEIKEYIHHELRSLKSFLEAIHVIREISPRSHDMIVGTGERLSARLMSGVLRDQNVEAVYVDLSEILPGTRNVLDKSYYRDLQKLIVEHLPENRKTVAIVTGFFGFVYGGIVASIGRGYSDLTAALIAAELKAEELQIWKEVDGIFTADPRKVPTATVLDYITPAEAAELTYFGSEVLHPFTMERAIEASVPIRIKNTFTPEKPGTVILPSSQAVAQTNQKQTAVAVTTKKDVVIINIHSNRMLHASGFMSKVFSTFQKFGVIVDLIATSEVNISCTLDDADHLEDVIKDLEGLAEVTISRNKAILSLVGERMKYVPGTAGKMFTALAQHSINIEMISQGASEINISCVIRQEDAEKALNVIHKTFLENNG